MRRYANVRDMMTAFVGAGPRPLRGPRERADWADLPGEKFIAEPAPSEVLLLAVTSVDLTLIATERVRHAPWQQYRFTFASALDMGAGRAIRSSREAKRLTRRRR